MDRKTDRQKYNNVDGFSTPSHSRLPQPNRQVQPPNAPTNNPVPEPQAQSNPPVAAGQGPAFPRYYSPYAPKQLASNLPDESKTKPKWSRKKKILTGALATLLIMVGFGTYFGSRILGNIDKVFHGNVFSDVNALFTQTKLKGEDQGRVNILLAGNSADDPNHGGAQLTDSIMIVSIDTNKHTGFMLSVPRDLWVDIPGLSHEKINAANDVTNFSQSGYPNGGMGQLEQVVQTDLGIPIDYYGLINYTAFRDSVNAVGGITVNIQSPDPRGLYDPNINKADGGPLKLPNGTMTLNGQTALNLARARGDPCYCGSVEYGFPQGDFNRTQHQRQMLVALAKKSQSVGVVTNPFKVSSLFKAFGSNVQTDLTLQDVLRLADITKGINISNLQSLAYSTTGSNPLLKSYTAPDGEEAFIPTVGIDNYDQIQQYYQQLTSSNPVVREAPTVVVLNASNITGLAHKQATMLKSKGFNVIGAADANNEYPGSMIVDSSNNQKPASKQLLQQLFSSNTTITTSTTSSAEAAEAQGYTANFVIILVKN